MVAGFKEQHLPPNMELSEDDFSIIQGDRYKGSTVQLSIQCLCCDHISPSRLAFKDHVNSKHKVPYASLSRNAHLVAFMFTYQLSQCPLCNLFVSNTRTGILYKHGNCSLALMREKLPSGLFENESGKICRFAPMPNDESDSDSDHEPMLNVNPAAIVTSKRLNKMEWAYGVRDILNTMYKPSNTEAGTLEPVSIQALNDGMLKLLLSPLRPQPSQAILAKQAAIFLSEQQETHDIILNDLNNDIDLMPPSSDSVAKSLCAAMICSKQINTANILNRVKTLHLTPQVKVMLKNSFPESIATIQEYADNPQTDDWISYTMRSMFPIPQINRKIIGVAEPRHTKRIQIQADNIIAVIRSRKKRCPTGNSSYRASDILFALTELNEASGIHLLMESLFTSIANADINRNDVLKQMLTLRGIALNKQGTGKPRPICILEPIVAIVDMLLTKMEEDLIKEMIGPHQIGMFIKGASEVLAHSIAINLDMYPSNCTITVDKQNAYNSLDRKRMLQQINKVDAFSKFGHMLYNSEVKPSVIFSDASGEILILSLFIGVLQGAASSQWIFNSAIANALERTSSNNPECTIIASTDDIHITGPPIHAIKAANEIDLILYEENGLLSVSYKSKIYSPTALDPTLELLAFKAKLNICPDGLIISGNPVGCISDLDSLQFISECNSKIVDCVHKELQILKSISDSSCPERNQYTNCSQICIFLLNRCFVQQFTHRTRGTIPVCSNQAAKLIDNDVLAAFMHISHLNQLPGVKSILSAAVSNGSPELIKRHRGMILRITSKFGCGVPSSHPECAFIGSLALTLPKICSLVPGLKDFIHSSDENTSWPPYLQAFHDALAHLKSIPGLKEIFEDIIIANNINLKSMSNESNAKVQHILSKPIVAKRNNEISLLLPHGDRIAGSHKRLFSIAEYEHRAYWASSTGIGANSFLHANPKNSLCCIPDQSMLIIMALKAGAPLSQFQKVFPLLIPDTSLTQGIKKDQSCGLCISIPRKVADSIPLDLDLSSLHAFSCLGATQIGNRSRQAQSTKMNCYLWLISVFPKHHIKMEPHVADHLGRMDPSASTQSRADIAISYFIPSNDPLEPPLKYILLVDFTTNSPTSKAISHYVSPGSAASIGQVKKIKNYQKLFKDSIGTVFPISNEYPGAYDKQSYLTLKYIAFIASKQNNGKQSKSELMSSLMQVLSCSTQVSAAISVRQLLDNVIDFRPCPSTSLKRNTDALIASGSPFSNASPSSIDGPSPVVPRML